MQRFPTSVLDAAPTAFGRKAVIVSCTSKHERRDSYCYHYGCVL